MRYILILLTLIFSACSPSTPSAEDELNKLAKAYELQPNSDRATEYLNKASEYIGNNKENFESIKPTLLKASEIAVDAKMLVRASGYLMAIAREDQDVDEVKNSLKSLGGIMKSLNKPHAANIIYQGLIERFPDDSNMASLKSELSADLASAEGYLTYLFDQVLVEPDEYGINRQNALRFVDGCEAYALSLPNSDSTPEFLYKAAEVARSLRTMPKAMALYDWILDKYPNHEKGPTTLFIKGFLLEQEFGQDTEARLVYEKFLEMYPDHEMASSAKFLLSNMGKSDEEILKDIEEKRKTNSDQES